MITELRLGTNEGIAGEYNIKSLADVLALTPHQDIYTWCDGRNEDSLTIAAILRNGYRMELESATHHSDASNYIADATDDAAPVGVQIAGLDVARLELTRIIDNQDTDETWAEFIQIETLLDPGKIRRRIEDALRKAHPGRVLEIALHLGVKLD